MDAGPPPQGASLPLEPPTAARAIAAPPATGENGARPSRGHHEHHGHEHPRHEHLGHEHLGHEHPAGAERREAPPHRGTPKALVLNASMDPLCVVSARRALVLVLSSRADVLHSNGHRFRSESLDLPAPSVIRLRRFVHVPYRRRAALSRRGVFLRDGHVCQYCGRAAENVDHVVPRSRGGRHEWENVVAACRRCNARKKDRTPGEAGMALSRSPYAPRAAFWLVVAVGRVDPVWRPYLGDALLAG